MRTFEHPNTSNGWVCPICKTNRDLPVTLIGIVGTEEGGNMQAEQFHMDCIIKLDFSFSKEHNVLYANIEEK